MPTVASLSLRDLLKPLFEALLLQRDRDLGLALDPQHSRAPSRIACAVSSSLPADGFLRRISRGELWTLAKAHGLQTDTRSERRAARFQGPRPETVPDGDAWDAERLQRKDNGHVEQGRS